jgi:hypothetical protein
MGRENMKKISFFTVLTSIAGASVFSSTSNAYEYRTGEGKPIYYDMLENEYNNSFSFATCDENDSDCKLDRAPKIKLKPTVKTSSRKVRYTSNNRQFQSGQTKSQSAAAFQPKAQPVMTQPTIQPSYELGPLESAFEIAHPENGWEGSLNYFTGTSHFEFTTSTNSKLKWLNMDTSGVELNLRKYWTSGRDNQYFLDLSLAKGSTDTDYTTDDDITNPLVVFSAGTGDGELNDYKIGFGYKSKRQILGFDTRYVFGFKRKNMDLQMLGHQQPVTKYLTSCTNHVSDSSGAIPDIKLSDGSTVGGLCQYTFNANTSIEGFLSPENIEYRDTDGDGDFDVYKDYNSTPVASPNYVGDSSITVYIPLGNLIQKEDEEYEIQEVYFTTDSKAQHGMIDMNNAQMNDTFGGYAFTNDITKPNEPTQIYDVTWDGIYAGIELEKALSMRDYLKFYAEVFYGKYTADGNWPARGLTFEDEASSATGFTFSAEYNYILQNNVTLFAGWTYDYLEAKDGDTTYADGSVTENLIDEAFWKYNGFKFGLKAGF